MTPDRTWVAPPEPALLSRLSGAPVVIALADARRLGAAVQASLAAGVNLHGVLIHSDVAVTAHRPDAAWRDVPVVLHAPRLGPLRDFLRMRRDLAALDLRLFLPADPESLRAVRIAASLGVKSGVDLGDTVDWNALVDLAAYALLGLVPHAPISPFAELAERYVPSRRTDLGHVYLDDPTRYLHLDPDGRVALGPAELAARRFVSERLEEPVPDDHPEYLARVEGWRAHFLEPAGCGWCAGFRICLGRLRGKGEGCGAFCEELIELVEKHQAKTRRAPRWQP